MATALITGGTGFVGSHIARTLLAAGHQVRILRRSNSSLALINDLPVEHAIGDVLEPASLDVAMQGCDWVFHVAAVADYWRSNAIKMYLVNVNGTIEVLAAARRSGVRRVIVTSSAAAIGLHPDGQPADETVAFNLHPSRFPYGHSKSLAEQEVLRAVESGQDAVILNPAIILGPGDINLISGSLIVETAKSYIPVYPPGGMAFIDVRDVAAAHLAAAEHGRSGERYILAAMNITYKALSKLIADVVGSNQPILKVPRVVMPPIAVLAGWLRAAGANLPIDANQLRLSGQNLYYDFSKAWRELGEPKIDIRQSLEDTYRWYIEHGMIEMGETASPIQKSN